MDKIIAKEYLSEIADLVSESLHEAAVASTDEGAVLLMTASSPFGEDKELSYSVELEEFGQDMLIFNTMIYCFTDVPDDRLGEAEEVINELNLRLTLGTFRTFPETHCIMLTHGFLTDGDTDAVIAARMLLANIALMENAAANAGTYLNRLLAGECTAEEIVSELESQEVPEQ